MDKIVQNEKMSIQKNVSDFWKSQDIKQGLGSTEDSDLDQ